MSSSAAATATATTNNAAAVAQSLVDAGLPAMPARHPGAHRGAWARYLGEEADEEFVRWKKKVVGEADAGEEPKDGQSEEELLGPKKAKSWRHRLGGWMRRLVRKLKRE